MKLFEATERIIKRVPLYFQQFRTLIKKVGVLEALKKACKKACRFIVTGGDSSKLMRVSYKEWIENIESEYLNEKRMLIEYNKLKIKPRLSIIFPVWNKSEDMLQKALDSITDQVYDNWEICISDGS
ncbi:MAG: glycosyltransferase, partial [Candidatus Dojkabacteria bacterium]